jgi:membrane fusion protein YbhG
MTSFGRATNGTWSPPRQGKNLEPGATAAPGAAIVTLVDPTDLWLRADISETDLGRVRLGQSARVTVDAFPGQPFEGRVTEVASGAEFTPRNVQTQEERVDLVFRVGSPSPSRTGG